MRMYHVNFRREQSVHLYDEKGRMRKGEVRRVQDLLRCHHSGRRHRIDRRLLELLYQVSRRFSGRRIEVVAGYRDRRYARTRRSPHTEGRAVDFRVSGISNEALRDYLRRLPNVGVGYYPNSSFVHLDVRGRSAFWIDHAGPGEEAQYAEDPERELRIQGLLRGR